MMRSLFSASTGMKAQELNIDVISNNLANVNTTGFKGSRAEFQDLIYQSLLEPGAATSSTSLSPSGLQVGLGVAPTAIQRIFTQGDLTATENQLDVAIEGDGFFQISRADGTIAYTRSGAFQLDDTGQIVNADGFPIDPSITVPPDALSISIGQDGTVEATVPGTTTPTNLGQITGVRFPNNGGLKPLGNGLYLETISSGSPTTGIFSEDGFGRLSQGFLESSNVSVVEQVVNMITAQRAYEANSKSIQTADDMINQAINMKR